MSVAQCPVHVRARLIPAFATLQSPLNTCSGHKGSRSGTLNRNSGTMYLVQVPVHVPGTYNVHAGKTES